MKKLGIFLMCLLLTAGFALTACSLGGGGEADLSGDIKITGSSSVTPLMRKLAAKFEELHPDVRIEVLESDSGTGVLNTQEGTNDFGMASRALKATETGVTSRQICTDGVAIIAAPSASITNVTSAQIF